MQNVLVTNIPGRNVDAFVAQAGTLGVPLAGSPFQRGTLSCTGSEYCKLAIDGDKAVQHSARAGARGAAARIHSIDEAQRERMPEFVRAALDRRHGAAGNSDEER